MSKILILDTHSVNYSVYQLITLANEFDNIFLVHKPKEQKYFLDDFISLIPLINQNKLQFQLLNSTDTTNVIATFAFLIGSIRHGAKEIQISSKMNNLEPLASFSTPSCQISFEWINPINESVPSIENKEEKAQDLSPQNKIEYSHEDVDFDEPPITQLKTQDHSYKDNAVDKTVHTHSMSKTSKSYKERPTLSLKHNKTIHVPQSSKTRIGVMGSSVSPQATEDQSPPVIDPSEYIFNEKRTKEDFIKRLLSSSRNSYYDYAKAPFAKIETFVEASSANALVRSTDELNVLRAVCLTFVAAHVLKLNKAKIVEHIDKTLIAHNFNSQFNSGSIFTKLKNCHIISKQADSENYVVNKGFVLLFINNLNLDFINSTLESHDVLTTNQRYNSLIELGIQFSSRDIVIVSLLSKIILTAANYNQRPTDLESFTSALIVMLSCTRPEADFAVSLLKRFELVNFNKEQNKVYNDPKLLRISTLESDNDVELNKEQIVLDPMTPNESNTNESNTVVNSDRIDQVEEQPTDESQNSLTQPVLSTPIETERKEETQTNTQANMQLDFDDSTQPETITEEAAQPQDNSIAATDAVQEPIAPVQEPKSETKATAKIEKPPFELTESNFSDFKQILGKLDTSDLLTSKHDLIQSLDKLLSSKAIKVNTNSFYDTATKYWIFQILSHDEDDDRILISQFFLDNLKSSSSFEEFKVFIEGIQEYAASGAPKKISKEERFLNSFNRIPVKADKRPKIMKGLVGIISKLFDTEAEAKLMIQVMENAKLFEMDGKKLVFNNHAFNYWLMRDETIKNS